MTSSPQPSPRETPRSLRAQVRRAWARLRGGELTPARAALSVALGLFVGVLPLPGLHLPIVLAVALPLRLDAAVAYLAANISIPPVAPFLWLGAIELGALALRGATVPLSSDGARELVARGPGPLLGALALGAVMLGAALALLGGGGAYVLARALGGRRAAGDGSGDAEPRRDEQDHDDAALASAIERTAARYAGAARSRASYHFARGKLRGDPATRAVARLAPLGDVLDVGCGRGQLAVLLLEAGAATRVRGWDWDEEKLALARRAAGTLPAEFDRRDVRALIATDATAAVPPADTVMLIDVLHYFDRATQDALLAGAAALVRPGGRLVLREADRGRGLRSALTRVQEAIGTGVGINRGERVLFRDVTRELVPLLEARGMVCAVAPCWGRTPLSNVLLVATKPSDAVSERARG